MTAARKPLVYVAGPITGDPWGCVRRATHAAAILGDADELIEYAALSYRWDTLLGPGRHLLSAVGDAARSGGAT